MNSEMVDEIVSILSAKLPNLDDREAARAMEALAMKVYPRPFVCEEMTVAEAIRKFVEKQAPRCISKLPSKFGSFSHDFFLTPGLHIIAGMTGHGKTFWAMEWAKHTEGDTLMLSLEMSWEDLAAREITQTSDFTLRSLSETSLTDTQKLALASLDFGHLERLHYRNYGSMDWSEIKRPLEQDIARLKPKLIIIDFIQLLEDSEADDNRISRIYQQLCRQLRFKAIREGFAVIVLSQLNRDSYLQARKTSLIDSLGYLPLGVESLKESGGIAEAADSVQFVVMLGKLPGCPPEYHQAIQISVEKSRGLGPQKPALFPIDYSSMKFKL